MYKFTDKISDILKKVFNECGYDPEKISASVSNRPDLCEYQCNGAMILAKSAGKPALTIAEEVAERLSSMHEFKKVDAVRPGFINFDISDDLLAAYVNSMADSDKFGYEGSSSSQKIIVDYGGANVAKPLHIGHLRSAIIGESLKRILNFAGNDAIGDVHLGDWGLQMGQVIAELKLRGMENDFTISDLEEVYPAASKKCKESSEDFDKEFADTVHEITGELQKGNPEYKKIWDKIISVSKADLKKNYDSLDVHFELWKGESDVQPYIPDMIQRFKDEGYAYESQGAFVIDVSLDSDKKELPPCIVVKSDGASLYATTDLATLVEREKLFDPDFVLYVVDKRQSLHLEQVFRASKKTAIVPDKVRLYHLGFGTMNGKDGLPYKTRSGGVMRLESLLNETYDAVIDKMKENKDFDPEEAGDIAKKIALAAIKYGDLSNQAAKDYIFDISRFTSFEGNTGPYILYTIVRIKSILGKCTLPENINIISTGEPSEKALMMELARFSEVMETAVNDLAPHKICSYIYDVSNAFNTFYHEVKILSETDENKKNSYIKLLMLTQNILEQCIELLGFSAPDRM